MSDTTIIISLISLGFFGGFSHCTAMCGPLVITQISNRLENIPLQEFSTLKKLQSLALLPYHLGRITTYTIIGILCSTFTKSIKDFTQFKSISAIFLFLASLIFLNLFFEKKLLTLTKTKLKNKLPFKSKTLKISALKISTIFFKAFPFKKLNFLKSFLSLLFKNPKGLNGYLLGVILGFIPCGLLYGAFLLAASIDSPLSAGMGMLLFGIATTPALFLSACGGFIFLKIFKTEFRVISKAVILINCATLFIMAISLIN